MKRNCQRRHDYVRELIARRRRRIAPWREGAEVGLRAVVGLGAARGNRKSAR
jgi:hypothetical protein